MDAKRVKNAILIFALVLLAFLSASGLLEKAAGKIGFNRIDEANKTYIAQSFDASMNGFLILSAIKSGLAVIEGSEVGVGFNLEVGDVVQSVYDYVDVAWKTALMGGTVLLLTQLLLQVVALINHWCLALAVLFFLGIRIQMMGPQTENKPSLLLRNLFSMFTVMTVALYVIFPLSIQGAAWLSGKITNPLMTEAREGFSSVKEDLSVESLSNKLFPDDSNSQSTWMDRLNLSGQYEKAKRHLKALANYLAKKAEEISVWTIKLIAGYVFDCLIFPATFFVLLYLFTRFSFQYLLNMSLVGYRERMASGT